MSGIIGVSPDMRSGVLGTWPIGHVIQVQHNTYSTGLSTASNTYVTCGFSQTITPSSKSNKILAMLHISGVLTDDTDEFLALTLYRTGGASGDGNLATGGGDALSSNDAFAIFRHKDASQGSTGISYHYVDSPGVQTVLTYTPMYGSKDGDLCYIQVWDQTSTITLIEIQQ